METISTLLAICEGNSPVTGEFPTQRPRKWKQVKTVENYVLSYIQSNIYLHSICLCIIYIALNGKYDLGISMRV